MSRRPRLVERKLGRERADGAYDPEAAVIEIDPRLRARRRCHVLAHEALHHALPEADEAEVERVAGIVAGAYWGDNWRRVMP